MKFSTERAISPMSVGSSLNIGYFILEGCVVFSTSSGKPYRKILPGMHFGEISILKDVRGLLGIGIQD